MKKNVYIHIGIFKTGTTSIQRFMQENLDKFSEYGYYVPRGLIINHHILPLSLIYKYTGVTFSNDITIDRNIDYWNELKIQIENSKQNNILISSEAFCNFIHHEVNGYYDKFSEFIKNFFKDYNIIIILYLRDLHEYILSMYLELCKRSIDFSLIDYINLMIKNGSFHIRPSKIIEFYKKIFPDKNIIIKKYNKNKFINNDVINDFLDILKIDSKIYSKQIKENISLKYDDVICKYIINKFRDKKISYQFLKNLTKKTDSNVIDYIKKSTELVNKYTSEKLYFNLHYFDEIQPKFDYRDVCLISMLDMIFKKIVPGLPYDFSEESYTRKNPDIVGSGMTPKEHWLKYGQYEGRSY